MCFAELRKGLTQAQKRIAKLIAVSPSQSQHDGGCHSVLRVMNPGGHSRASSLCHDEEPVPWEPARRDSGTNETDCILDVNRWHLSHCLGCWGTIISLWSHSLGGSTGTWGSKRLNAEINASFPSTTIYWRLPWNTAKHAWTRQGEGKKS